MHTLLLFIAHYKSSTICTLSFKLLTAVFSVFSILVTSQQVNLFNLLNTVELDQEIEKIYIFSCDVSFQFHLASFIFVRSLRKNRHLICCFCLRCSCLCILFWVPSREFEKQRKLRRICKKI